MIDPVVFRDVWTKLCHRFGRSVDNDEAADYLVYLEDNDTTTDDLLRAATKAWATREFFPRPVDLASESIGARALAEWEICEAVMEGRSGAFERLSDTGRKLVRLLGGETILRQTQLENVVHVRREWLKLYADTEEIMAREASTALPPMSAAGQRLLDAALKGESMPA